MTETGRDIVVVLGMHRSGTSLVAGLLNLLGVHLGRNLVPARGDNPRGFFENQEIVEVHKRINRALQRRPMTLGGTLHMPDDWQSRPALARYRDQLLDILRAEMDAAGDSPCGFKDPHAARLLPLWQDIFRTLSLRPRYIVCVRGPAAVAESLRRRDNIRREHAELLWLQHYLGALQPGLDSLAAILEYERWFQDFAAQFRRLTDGAGVNAELGAARLEQARAFAAAELNHAPRGGTIDNPLVERLYTGIREHCAGKLPAAELDRVVAECDGAARGFKLWSDLLGGRTSALTPAWEALAQGAAAAGNEEGAEFPALAGRLAPASGSGPLRICVVTYELDGPVRNSGRGSEAADIAVALAAAGHAVTILYVPRQFSEEGDFQQWVAHFAALGVELVALGTLHGQSEARWLRDYRPGARLPLCRPGAVNVYNWLKTRCFDVVHAFDCRGALYYCLLAKRLGMHHPNVTETLFHVRAHGPEKLRLAHNAQPMEDVQELGTAYMERRVVELADIVTAPAPAILEDFRREHFTLAPGRVLVLPCIGCHHRIDPPEAELPLEEIVFFGSLEPRKGLNLFVDALTWLQRDLAELRTACGGRLPGVRFLGGAQGDFPAPEYLRNRTAGWQLPVIVETETARAAALKLLATGGRLAVFPGTESHPPLGLMECLQYRIPFLAGDTPAHRALLAAEDHAAILFELHPHRLARALLGRLRANVPPPAPDAAVAPEIWLRWHRAIATEPTRWRRQFHFQPRAATGDKPLVSVCVAHFNRPHFLQQSLASLAVQTYKTIEVVVVDDGSTDPEAIRYLNEIEPDLERRGWRIVRQENRYLGAVRNAGARNARGKYCLFMDDDNYAKPDEIEMFVRIAEHTGADILTCFADVFHGDEPPDPAHEGRQVITQLGDNLAMGLFRNGFGDSNCFVQRDFFLDIGGSSEDYKVGKDDQEFFARSVLAGARLFLVPEALYWYRETPVRMRSLHYNLYAGNLRVMRPYLAASPPALRDVLRFAQGQMITFQKHLGREQYRRELNAERVMAVLDSSSWRLTRPLRSLMRRVSRSPEGEFTREQVEALVDPAVLLAQIHASASWQLAGPWRLLLRVGGALSSLKRRVFGR